MHRSRALAVAVIATFAFTASAQAQTPPPPGRGGPPGAQVAVFVNPMGQPFRSAPESRRAPILLWLAQADTDRDEKISRDEFIIDATAFFTDTLDANHDGGATSVESTELWRTQAPEMLSERTAPVVVASSSRRPASDPDSVGPRGSRIDGRARPRGGRPGEGPPHGASQRLPIMLGAELEPVMSCDRDFSRRIDRTEFEACSLRRFTALDTNNDGFFSLYESERAREMIEQAEARAVR